MRSTFNGNNNVGFINNGGTVIGTQINNSFNFMLIVNNFYGAAPSAAAVAAAGPAWITQGTTVIRVHN